MVFQIIKKMFTELLSVCTTRRFGGSLAFNSKLSIKCVSLNNRPYQARPTLVNITLIKLFIINLLPVLISVLDVIILLMIHMLE